MTTFTKDDYYIPPEDYEKCIKLLNKRLCLIEKEWQEYRDWKKASVLPKSFMYPNSNQEQDQ